MGDPITTGLLIGGGALLGAKFLGKKSSSDTASRTVQASTPPSVADDTAAEKQRRLIGRNALIATQQDDKDILGEPKLGRNELTAF